MASCRIGSHTDWDLVSNMIMPYQTACLLEESAVSMLQIFRVRHVCQTSFEYVAASRCGNRKEMFARRGPAWATMVLLYIATERRHYFKVSVAESCGLQNAMSPHLEKPQRKDDVASPDLVVASYHNWN